MIYNSIETYDKNNNLVGYIEFKDNRELKCSYQVNGNILRKRYYRKFNEENQFFEDTISGVIDFENNIRLKHFFLDGETLIRAIEIGTAKSNQLSPNIKSRIDILNDDNSIECFTIKSDLINEWLNKL